MSIWGSDGSDGLGGTDWYDDFLGSIGITPSTTGSWSTPSNQQILDSIGYTGNLSDAFGFITKLLSGQSGLGQLGSVVGAGGIAALLNNLFDKPTGPAGYRGGIPEYTASFTQTPIAQQRPAGYRPGQGGITYFNPIQYTHTGRDLTAPVIGTAPVPAPPPATPAPAPGPVPDPSIPINERESTGAAAGGYMNQGIAMLAQGGSGSRFLRGGGDGTSDSIPAKFEHSGQPARLADGEFVIDARTVSEIGNGSSEAGARKLYAMMDRVHAARKKAKRGKPSNADKFLPK